MSNAVCQRSMTREEGEAPEKREFSILKTWRGRAWDTSVYSDQQLPKLKLRSEYRCSHEASDQQLPKLKLGSQYRCGHEASEAIGRHETGTVIPI